jgi:hypothetical protein
MVDEASLDRPPVVSEAPNRRRVNKKALLALLAGPIVSLAGVLLALNILNVGSELVALSGILILAVGLLITSITLVGMGPSFRTLWSWRLFRKGLPRLTGKYGSYDSRPREVEAEENKTSSEEQFESGAEKLEREKEHFD